MMKESMKYEEGGRKMNLGYPNFWISTSPPSQKVPQNN
jgi:hypothetical protein